MNQDSVLSPAFKKTIRATALILVFAAVLPMLLAPALAQAQILATSITATLSATNIAYGGTINYTVINNAAPAGVYAGWVEVNGATQAQTFSGNGPNGSGTLPVQIGQSGGGFQPTGGSNQVRFLMQYPGAGGTQSLYASPFYTVTVTPQAGGPGGPGGTTPPAGTGGTVTLTMVQPTPPPANNQVTLQFNTSGSNIIAGVSVFYDCNVASPPPPPTSGTQITGSGVATGAFTGNFSCTYPTNGQSVTVQVSAVNASGGSVASQFITFTVASNGGVSQTGSGAGPTSGTTQNSGGPVEAILITILGIISGIIRQLMYWAYSLLILPFISGAAVIKVGAGQCGGLPGTIGFLSIVCDGWGYVRNVVNMLFILIMIVIGLATILRIESYNYKKLLGRLIIMALLVNFSLVIAQAILALADVLQATFFGSPTDITKLKQVGETLINRGQLQNNISIIDILFGNSPRGTIDILVSQIIELTLSFTAFITFAGIAFFMVVRLVMIWFLLILSPFAYAFMILPSTKSLASSWWSNFLKYAFFTPIMFFFIRIAVSLQGAQNALGMSACGFATSNPTATAAQCVGQSGAMSQFIYSNAQQFVTVVFLFAALMVAQKLSIFGAGAVMTLAKTAALLPIAAGTALGGAAVGVAGRVYSGKMTTNLRNSQAAQKESLRQAADLRTKASKAATGAERAKLLGQAAQAQRTAKIAGFKTAGYTAMAMANPRVLKQAWEERKKIKDEEVYHTATSQMHDRLNKAIPWDKRETYFEKQAIQKSVNEMYRDLAAGNHDEQETAHIAFNSLKNEKNAERVEGVLKYVVATNRQDDLVKYWQQHREEFGAGTPMRDLGDKHLKGGYDSFDFDQFVNKMMKSRFGEHEATEMASHIQEFSESENKWRSQGMVVNDSETGKKVMTSEYQEMMFERLKKANPGLSDDDARSQAEEAAVKAKWDETRGRMMRGDSERVAKALETAQLRVQYDEADPDNTFGKLNKVAKYAIEGMPAQVVSSIEKTRGVQARSGRIAGLEGNENGEITPDSVHYNKLAETYEKSDSLTRTLVGRAQFDPDKMVEIETRLKNEFVRQADAAQSAGNTARADELRAMSEKVILRQDAKVSNADKIIEHVTTDGGHAATPAGGAPDAKQMVAVQNVAKEMYKDQGMDPDALADALKRAGVGATEAPTAAKKMIDSYTQHVAQSIDYGSALNVRLPANVGQQIGKTISDNIAEVMKVNLNAGYKVDSNKTKVDVEARVKTLLQGTNQSRPDLFKDTQGKQVFRDDQARDEAFDKIAKDLSDRAANPPKYEEPKAGSRK